MRLRFALVIFSLVCVPALSLPGGRADTAHLRVAVLDFGATEGGRRAADVFSTALAKNEPLKLVDRELARSAALGMGYTNSLNLTLEEARHLGAAIGCDILITGDSQTLRRSPSDGSVNYESYASIFVVSARTGALLMWTRPSRAATTPEMAETSLLDELRRDSNHDSVEMHRRIADESVRLTRESTREASAYEDAPEEGSAGAVNFRPPEPYRRVRPPYPDTAAAAEAEATVDARVEIGADGEVARVEIVRWAGFGLDESVADTIRRMHFRPAMRDGVGVPVRVLLRYNFRRPPKTK